MHSTYETTMLICGIVLFLFGLGLIAFLVRAGKSFVGVTALIAIAIVMIGFPLIKSAKIGPGGIEFDAKAANDFAKNPGEPAAKAAYEHELAVLEKSHVTDPAQELTPQTRTSLQAVAQRLSVDHDLSPESRVTLARTQLLLGQTEDATTNVRTVMTTHPQLITANSNLPKLVRLAPVPPSR